ncbi:hypothetical protein FBX98_13215 [Burkholderia sp. SJZ115]|nr:hypothetical protein FB600_13227 [Burkholderia sp. SJZ089]TWC94068.1 hypothetical protein FBX98_13215 [Burkholderia sp. SJZ115]TWC96242.1 hypothetical protein FB601_13215 [Burkholderia sp. SJZ091]
MSMQDIADRFAVPVARPFSNLPPPYGRGSALFVTSHRAGLRVFDLRTLHGPRARCAADFGSENRAWLTVNPPRCRSRPLLAASLAFTSLCVAATYILGARHGPSSPDTVYLAAISMAPEQGAKMSATLGVDTSREISSEVTSPVSAGLARRVREGMSSGGGGRVIGELEGLDVRPKARVLTTSSKTGRNRRAGLRRASTLRPAEAVGMTETGFAYWFDATHEPAHQAGARPVPGELDFVLTHQTRLISR